MFNSYRPHHIFQFLFTAVLALGMTVNALGAPGDLDTTFGTGGKVTTNSASSLEEARAVVVQPDGKILVAGYQSAGLAQTFWSRAITRTGRPIPLSIRMVL
jgi:hypothetical protein